MIDIKRVKQLLKLMNENDLSEISITQGEDAICLKKEVLVAAQTILSQPMQQHVAPPLEPSQSEKTEGKEKESSHLKRITAPMVGTFYRSPSPEAAPYVTEGEEIKEGAVLCILEAMKLMNEVKSEISGKIVEILVENTQPVEFGQPLFLVEQAE